MEENLFQEYTKESEPNKRSKGYAWSTAIGLQATDQLKPSKYLLDTAIQNIEGKITLNEAENLIDSYYKESPLHKDGERTEEADKVSVRIARILSENAFSFSPNEYLSIHRKLFLGIYSHAGKIRDYNITKKEWVLDGATVVYGSASELRATLEYDFSQERNFSYRGLSVDEIIHHLAIFVSNLWQIHIFGEGNTRTTAVFFIKYLRRLGFSATNDIFADHAWYFRNALVRANYTNLQKGIHETTEYLELFLRNLLLNERNELRSRNLHIRAQIIPSLKETDTAITDVPGEVVEIQDGKSDIQDEKVDIQGEEVDVQGEEVDIQDEKVDIQGEEVDIQGEEVDIQDEEVDIQDEEVDIQGKKVDIQDKKVDAQDKKADIQGNKGDIRYNESEISSIFAQKNIKITNKTVGHIKTMYQKYGYSGIFGRSEVASLLGLQNSSVSKLIAKLLEAGIIEYVSGHGKGKYRFI